MGICDFCYNFEIKSAKKDQLTGIFSLRLRRGKMWRGTENESGEYKNHQDSAGLSTIMSKTKQNLPYISAKVDKSEDSE